MSAWRTTLAAWRTAVAAPRSAEAEVGPANPHHNRIELSLPPDSRYMRLARLMASGVATTCGLSPEEVEDFRIAVDELCATLIEIGNGGQVRLAFDLTQDAVVVEGRTSAMIEGVIDE